MNTIAGWSVKLWILVLGYLLNQEKKCVFTMRLVMKLSLSKTSLRPKYSVIFSLLKLVRIIRRLRGFEIMLLFLLLTFNRILKI